MRASSIVSWFVLPLVAACSSSTSSGTTTTPDASSPMDDCGMDMDGMSMDDASSPDAMDAMDAHHDPADVGAYDCSSGGPSGDELVFVGHGVAQDVRVIDPRACAVVATIPIGAIVSDATASTDGKYVFFTAQDANQVVVIDVAMRTVKAKVPVGTKPVHIFGSPDHASFWIGNDGSANVSQIDLATLTVSRTVATGAGHHKMAFADGSPYRVYASNIVANTISGLESDATTTFATIPVNPAPHGMDWSSVSKKVYDCSAATSPDAGPASPAGIDVIPTEGAAANTVVKRIELAARCNYLTFTPDDRWGFASVPSANQIVVFDATTDAIVATIPVGTMPDKIRFFAGGLAGTGNVGSPDFSIVDVASRAEIARVGIGMELGPTETSGHRAIVPSRDGAFAYAVDGCDGTVSIVDVASRKLRARVTVGEHPMAIAVAGASGGVVYPR